MKVEHICYEMGYNSWESLLEQKKVALLLPASAASAARRPEWRLQDKDEFQNC